MEEQPASWPPGWYDVPDRVDTRGYWDGTRWTGDYAPKSPAPPPPTAGAAPARAQAARNWVGIGVAGYVALAIGSIGPWATDVFSSASGTQADGKYTLGAAVIGAILLLLRPPKAVWSGAVALLTVATCIVDLVRVTHKAREFMLGGVQVVHVGWGLYVATGGAAVALVGAFMLAMSDS